MDRFWSPPLSLWTTGHSTCTIHIFLTDVFANTLECHFFAAVFCCCFHLALLVLLWCVCGGLNMLNINMIKLYPEVGYHKSGIMSDRALFLASDSATPFSLCLASYIGSSPSSTSKPATYLVNEFPSSLANVYSISIWYTHAPRNSKEGVRQDSLIHRCHISKLYM